MSTNAPPIDPAYLPSIAGNSAAAKYVRDVLGVPMTDRYFRQAMRERQLEPRYLRGRNYFSPAMLIEWVTGEPYEAHR